MKQTPIITKKDKILREEDEYEKNISKNNWDFHNNGFNYSKYDCICNYY